MSEDQFVIDTEQVIEYFASGDIGLVEATESLGDLGFDLAEALGMLRTQCPDAEEFQNEAA